MSEAPDIREIDCPDGDACDRSCDIHVGSPWTVSVAAVDGAARGAAAAAGQNCFDLVDDYEALVARYPEEYASGDDRPGDAYDSCQWWRSVQTAALGASVPREVSRAVGSLGGLASEFDDESGDHSERLSDFEDGYSAAMRDAATRVSDTFTALGLSSAPDGTTPSDGVPASGDVEVHELDTLRDCIVHVAWLAQVAARQHENGHRDAAADGLQKVMGRIPSDLVLRAAALTVEPVAPRSEFVIRADERERLACDAEERGDIGKVDGPNVWDWLRSNSAAAATPRRYRTDD